MNLNELALRSTYTPLPKGKQGSPELDAAIHAYTHDRRAWMVAATLGLARREVRELAQVTT